MNKKSKCVKPISYIMLHIKINYVYIIGKKFHLIIYTKKGTHLYL